MVYLHLTLVFILTALFLYAVWSAGQPVRWPPVLAAVWWGVTAFVAAFVLQAALLHAGLLSPAAARLVSAPLLEETLKALPLLALRARGSRISGGAVYGFTMGMSFAAVESAAYLLADPSNAFSIAVARLVSINLLHGITTGLVGLVSSSPHRRQPDYRLLAAALAAAVLLHASFNYLTGVLAEFRFYAALAFSLGSGLVLVVLSHRGKGHYGTPFR